MFSLFFTTMKNTVLLQVLDAISPLEQEARAALAASIEYKHLRKNELLWLAGDTCKHLVFVEKGLLRNYEYINHREITHRFYAEQQLFYDDYSFIAQKQCVSNYEALEETDLLLIPRTALYALYDQFKSVERLGRIAVEQAHVRWVEHLNNITTKSAEENFSLLLKSQPNLLQRVPQKMIASYLNITPEHLSKIKRTLLSR